MLARHLARHRNRSQLSLEPSQDEQDKRAYGEPSPGFTLHSAPSSQREEDDRQSYNLSQRSHQPEQPIDSHPARTQSIRGLRTPSSINTDQPTITVVSHNSASTPSSAIDDNPDRYYDSVPLALRADAEAPKKKRGFFGRKSAPQQLGRSVSVRRKEEPQPPAERNRGAEQKRWSTSNPSIADEEEGEEFGEADLRADKDPLRSPAFPPPLTHEEYVHGRSQLQNPNRNNSGRHPLDRQGSLQSSWEKTAHQTTKHLRNDSAQPTPSSYHPSPSSATSTSSHPFAPKSPLETLHQHQYENSRPPSQQSLERPTSSQHFRAPDKQTHTPVGSAPNTQLPMGIPPGQQAPLNRRSSESTQQSQQSQGREGAVYQPYNQGPQQGPVPPPNAPPPGYSTQHATQLAPQGQAYRGTSQTSPMAQHREQDARSSPPPNRSRDDLSSLDVAQLLQRHDELRTVTISFHLFFKCSYIPRLNLCTHRGQVP